VWDFLEDFPLDVVEDFLIVIVSRDRVIDAPGNVQLRDFS
jgi:hypothetical protein